MSCEKRIEVHPNEEKVIEALCSHIEKVASKAIGERDFFAIGVSGGSLVGALAKQLPNVKTDWSKWRIYFCDERIVPFDSADSTFGAYRDAIGMTVPLMEEQYRRINPTLKADEAAKDYIKKLQADFGGVKLPQFDMLLLGMGPDGHTCSLFPGHPLLEEKSVWVAPITNSPKPPPSRITLTFPVINYAKNCIFSAWGAGKADMIKRILRDKEDLPATRVHPTNGLCYWLIDEAAASKLNS